MRSVSLISWSMPSQVCKFDSPNLFLINSKFLSSSLKLLSIDVRRRFPNKSMYIFKNSSSLSYISISVLIQSFFLFLVDINCQFQFKGCGCHVSAAASSSSVERQPSSTVLFFLLTSAQYLCWSICPNIASFLSSIIFTMHLVVSCLLVLKNYLIGFAT